MPSEFLPCKVASLNDNYANYSTTVCSSSEMGLNAPITFAPQTVLALLTIIPDYLAEEN